MQGFTRETVRTGKRAGPSTGEQEGSTSRDEAEPWPWQGGLTPALPVSVEGLGWGLGRGGPADLGIWDWCGTATGTGTNKVTSTGCPG